MEKDMEGKRINPNWIRPDLQEERGEIERVVVEFLKQESTEENINTVVRTLESAPIIDLSDKEWSSLENTDSFHNVRSGHIEDAEKITKEYNSKLAPQNQRDFKTIFNGFSNGSKMKVPTILRDKNGTLHLISGNTRLMICRAFGVRPKVVIGTLG